MGIKQNRAIQIYIRSEKKKYFASTSFFDIGQSISFHFNWLDALEKKINYDPPLWIFLFRLRGVGPARFFYPRLSLIRAA